MAQLGTGSGQREEEEEEGKGGTWGKEGGWGRKEKQRGRGRRERRQRRAVGRKGEGEGGHSQEPHSSPLGPRPQPSLCQGKSALSPGCNIKAGSPASPEVASFEVWQRWGHISG